MGKFPKDAGRFKLVSTPQEQQARKQIVEELKRKAVAGVAENKRLAAAVPVFQGEHAAVSGENAPLHVGYVKFATCLLLPHFTCPVLFPPPPSPLSDPPPR